MEKMQYLCSGFENKHYNILTENAEVLCKSECKLAYATRRSQDWRRSKQSGESRKSIKE